MHVISESKLPDRAVLVPHPQYECVNRLAR